MWSQVAHYPTGILKYHCPSWLHFIRVALHRLYGPSQYITPLTNEQAALAGPLIVKMPVTQPSTEEARKRLQDKQARKKRKTILKGPPARPTLVPRTIPVLPPIPYLTTPFDILRPSSSHKPVNVAQAEEVKLLLPSEGSIQQDDDLALRVAASLMVPGDHGVLQSLRSLEASRRSCIASVRVSFFSNFLFLPST